MNRVVQDTKGKIRNLPITDELESILEQAAAAAGVDRVRVTSGGQPSKDQGGRRIGSTRHDNGNAADLQLFVGEHMLSFMRPSERLVFEQFVKFCAQRGATGIGAGTDYMGPSTIHVGFGPEMVWGAGGKSAAAPQWLRDAFREGRALASQSLPARPATAPAVETHDRLLVTARNGLRLRAAAGLSAPPVGVMRAGAIVWSPQADSGADWRRICLENDGQVDGFAAAAYLAKA